VDLHLLYVINLIILTPFLSGQALAANTAMLPAPFQTKFSTLFDDAPQVPYSEVEKVFKSEFGRPPAGENGIFDEFEEKAVASASIAQVHRAKLKKSDQNEPDEWVAVKIQKPAVSIQVDWDLAAYRLVMWMYEKCVFKRRFGPACFNIQTNSWVFDMPVYFLVGMFSVSSALFHTYLFLFRFYILPFTSRTRLFERSSQCQEDCRTGCGRAAAFKQGLYTRGELISPKYA